MSKIKLRKETIFIISLIFSLVFTLLTTYAKNLEKDLSKNFLRLHVIANSNSKEDQELKLKIRDKILFITKDWFKTCKSADESFEVLENKLAVISNIAKKKIEDLGYYYDVKSSMGEYLFPTKSYKNIILPAGKYKALKIKIGEAKGENWWCVLYPPLCFINGFDAKIPEKDENELRLSIPEKQYELIAESEEIPKIKIKFKIIEFFAPLFIKKT